MTLQQFFPKTAILASTKDLILFMETCLSVCTRAKFVWLRKVTPDSWQFSGWSLFFIVVLYLNLNCKGCTDFKSDWIVLLSTFTGTQLQLVKGNRMLTQSQDLRPMQLIFESASVNPYFSSDTCHSSLWKKIRASNCLLRSRSSGWRRERRATSQRTLAKDTRQARKDWE